MGSVQLASTDVQGCMCSQLARAHVCACACVCVCARECAAQAGCFRKEHRQLFAQSSGQRVLAVLKDRPPHPSLLSRALKDSPLVDNGTRYELLKQPQSCWLCEIATSPHRPPNSREWCPTQSSSRQHL
eukprot:1149763-Pelagomonas_calceolata.AAC.5